MNKNILGATMLSLVAFIANDCQATNLNVDSSEIQIDNDQLDMYKSKVAYFWRHQPCYDSPFDAYSDPYCISVDTGYEPYDTTIRIECTSKPTCM